MILLIDAGNTRVKIAVLQDKSMQFVTALNTSCPDTLQRDLKESIKTLGAIPNACTAVSVARGEINQSVQNALAGLSVRWVSPSQQAAGVINGYPDPSQLGADRWVSMIGLTRHFAKPHPPVVLASFGTATTVDTLSPSNEFKGGLILPGVTLMHRSLERGTANLPNAMGELADFPTNTISAITSGIAAAQVGAVARQVQIARQTYGQQPKVCVSGGAWLTVADELQCALGTTKTGSTAVLELPHIVLDGLSVLANSY